MRRAGLAALALVLAAPGGALAQVPCLDWAEFRARLAEDHDEELQSLGLMASGEVLAITVSPDGATWSALVVGPSGRACMVAVGRNWSGAMPADNPNDDEEL